MTRGGRVKERDEPERRCIVTRETGPKAGLIRFVAGPDDEVVPDLAERLPGRGMWVSADAATLRQAAGKGHFARAAKRQVRVPADLADAGRGAAGRRGWSSSSRWRARPARRWRGWRRPRRRSSPARRRCCCRRRTDRRANAAQLRPPEGENTLVSCLFAHELGLAFARDRVIHAAVLAGGLGDRIRDEALRLSGIRDVNDGDRVRRRPGRTDWRGKAPAGKARDGMMDTKDGTARARRSGCAAAAPRPATCARASATAAPSRSRSSTSASASWCPKPGAPAGAQPAGRRRHHAEPLGRRVRAAAEGRRGRQGAGSRAPAAGARGRRGPRGRARAPARREGGRRARREGARDPGAARRRRRRRGGRGRRPRGARGQAAAAPRARAAEVDRPRRRAGPGRARRGRPPDRPEEGPPRRPRPSRRSAAARKGEDDRRRSGKLTIANATDEEGRQRSMAAMKRRQEREKRRVPEPLGRAREGGARGATSPTRSPCRSSPTAWPSGSPPWSRR